MIRRNINSLQFIFQILIIVSCLNVNAQLNSIDHLENAYPTYFKFEPETIYTHLNKTKFLNGEEIWFKTYVYNNKTHKPYNSTTNLYVSIYNEGGVLIINKLIKTEGGIGNGNIKINEQFLPGIYYLQSTTNWTRNFKHYSGYLQKIEVVGEEVSSKENATIQTNKYDLQLLPESGTIIQDVTNSIGFKIIDSSGKGIVIKSGTVVDKDDKIITNFESNEFGMGKFSLNWEINNNYRVKVVLENENTLEKGLPIAKKKGISMVLENSNASSLFIKLETNNLTLPGLINNDFYLLMHRDGLLKKVVVKFEEDKLEYLISIPKSDLLAGVNIITLMDKFAKPISERIVFNNLVNPIKEVRLKNINHKKDSSIVRFKIDGLKDIKNNFSISVLPHQSKAYENQATILSTFLLSPYVKGNIENPSYYFKYSDRKVLYNLDLLLLNQGWRRFNWHDVFNNPPKVNFPFETGFQVKGKINNNDVKQDSKIVLSSPENMLHLNANIVDGAFTFSNLYIADSTSVYFSVKKKNGKLVKTPVYYTIYPRETLTILDTTGISLFYKRVPKTRMVTYNQDFLNPKDNNLLDTVILKATINPKNELYLNVISSRYINLSKSDFPNSLLFYEFSKYGFYVTKNNSDVYIKDRRGNATTTVYLDNVALYGDFAFLRDLKISEVEEIYVNKRVNTIHIFTKNVSETIKSSDNYQDVLVDYGFSIAKQYYTPRYNINSTDFIDYGAVNWIPNATTDKNNEFLIKIPNGQTKEFNLYIEGMGADGSLFSNVVNVH
ncbi:hypothetical protein FF125_17135 [Aureibaculum algae]|uniref:Macroglobulin domain-containing protein n=1 Tax=Aureibaculum algae TaxID=2584122 RepID=A0A5B7TTC0_9FLAO|nr:hypothetical protein [Aureibaculum algae]QCX40085.1 hypothetical protein FF125_17135 [Aureibaculum algae]